MMLRQKLSKLLLVCSSPFFSAQELFSSFPHVFNPDEDTALFKVSSAAELIQTDKGSFMQAEQYLCSDNSVSRALTPLSIPSLNRGFVFLLRQSAFFHPER